MFLFIDLLSSSSWHSSVAQRLVRLVTGYWAWDRFSLVSLVKVDLSKYFFTIAVWSINIYLGRSKGSRRVEADLIHTFSSFGAWVVSCELWQLCNLFRNVCLYSLPLTNLPLLRVTSYCHFFFHHTGHSLFRHRFLFFSLSNWLFYFSSFSL